MKTVENVAIKLAKDTEMFSQQDLKEMIDIEIGSDTDHTKEIEEVLNHLVANGTLEILFTSKGSRFAEPIDEQKIDTYLEVDDDFVD